MTTSNMSSKNEKDFEEEIGDEINQPAGGIFNRRTVLKGMATTGAVAGSLPALSGEAAAEPQLDTDTIKITDFTGRKASVTDDRKVTIDLANYDFVPGDLLEWAKGLGYSKFSSLTATVDSNTTIDESADSAAFDFLAKTEPLSAGAAGAHGAIEFENAKPWTAPESGIYTATIRYRIDGQATQDRIPKDLPDIPLSDLSEDLENVLNSISKINIEREVSIIDATDNSSVNQTSNTVRDKAIPSFSEFYVEELKGILGAYLKNLKGVLGSVFSVLTSTEKPEKPENQDYSHEVTYQIQFDAEKGHDYTIKQTIYAGGVVASFGDGALAKSTGTVDMQSMTITGSSGQTNSLRIEGPGEFTYYAFRASGDVSSDGNLTSEDNIDGTTAAGAVGGGADTYTFEGELQNLYVGDGATVFVNDQEVSLSDYESVLSVEGDGSYTSYEFGVSGEITGTQGTTGEDTVNPASVSGAIAGGLDSYTFTGTISGLSKSGSAAVLLNGQEVDPSLFSPFSGGTNSLRIEGPGNYTYYAFRASGGVSSDGSLTSEDNIDGATAAGAVGGGADTYSFEGELQNLYVGDGATVFVNEQEVSLSNYESVLSVEGSGNYTSYQFGVSGQITETQGITGEDSVTNSSASGAIAGGADTYTFTGDINSFTRNGDAAIVLNGQEVDPALL